MIQQYLYLYNICKFCNCPVCAKNKTRSFKLSKEWKSKDNYDAAKQAILTLEQMELTEKNTELNKTF